MNKVIIIVGPTAIGKSSLGMEIAKSFNGEIINGDSVSVYKKLNIGSAKASESDRLEVVHHLVDYKEVIEDYSVADFQKDARAAIEQIIAKGKVPIVVGGTGLYIKALIYDYNFAKQTAKVNDFEQETTAQLYEMLKEIDPASLTTIHPNNRKRIIRALQIAQSGHLKSEIESAQQHQMIYDVKTIGLTIEREKLVQRINKRVDLMIEEGLTKEVADLFKEYGSDHHCFSAIGYKEYIDYFNNKQSEETTIEQIKIHTRQFAKRQYTWFNHQMDVEWYNIEETNYKEKVKKSVSEFLTK